MGQQLLVMLALAAAAANGESSASVNGNNANNNNNNNIINGHQNALTTVSSPMTSTTTTTSSTIEIESRADYYDKSDDLVDSPAQQRSSSDGEERSDHVATGPTPTGQIQYNNNNQFYDNNWQSEPVQQATTFIPPNPLQVQNNWQPMLGQFPGLANGRGANVNNFYQNSGLPPPTPWAFAFNRPNNYPVMNNGAGVIQHPVPVLPLVPTLGTPANNNPDYPSPTDYGKNIYVPEEGGRNKQYFNTKDTGNRQTNDKSKEYYDRPTNFPGTPKNKGRTYPKEEDSSEKYRVPWDDEDKEERKGHYPYSKRPATSYTSRHNDPESVYYNSDDKSSSAEIDDYGSDEDDYSSDESNEEEDDEDSGSWESIMPRRPVHRPTESTSYIHNPRKPAHQPTIPRPTPYAYYGKQNEYDNRPRTDHHYAKPVPTPTGRTASKNPYAEHPTRPRPSTPGKISSNNPYPEYVPRSHSNSQSGRTTSKNPYPEYVPKSHASIPAGRTPAKNPYPEYVPKSHFNTQTGRTASKNPYAEYVPKSHSSIPAGRTPAKNPYPEYVPKSHFNTQTGRTASKNPHPEYVARSHSSIPAGRTPSKNPYPEYVPRSHSSERPSIRPKPTEGVESRFRIPLGSGTLRPITGESMLYSVKEKPSQPAPSPTSTRMCLRIDKKVSPNVSGKGTKNRVTCYTCVDADTGADYEQCSINSETEPRTFIQESGQSEKMSLPDGPRRTKRSPPKNIEKREDKYRFDKEHFTGNRRKLSSRDLPLKEGESCDKVRRKSSVCIVCRNSITGGSYEQCSFASDPKENSYERTSERIYGDDELPKSYKDRESSENESPENTEYDYYDEPRTDKRSPPPDEDQLEDEYDDYDEGQSKSIREERVTSDTEAYDELPETVRRETPTDEKVESVQRSKKGVSVTYRPPVGSDPYYYGRSESENKKRKERQNSDEGSDEQYEKFDKDEPEIIESLRRDSPSYEEYFYKLFPELADSRSVYLPLGHPVEDSEEEEIEEEEDEEAEYDSRSAEESQQDQDDDYGGEATAKKDNTVHPRTGGEDFDIEGNKRILEKAISSMARKDRTQCKKVMRDKMTCYRCLDDQGNRHEECLMLSSADKDGNKYRERTDPAGDDVKKGKAPKKYYPRQKEKRIQRSIAEKRVGNVATSTTSRIDGPPQVSDEPRTRTENGNGGYPRTKHVTSSYPIRNYKRDTPGNRDSREGNRPYDSARLAEKAHSSDGAFSHLTKQVYDGHFRMTLPRFMVEKSPFEIEFDEDTS